ncbi:HNH endonuclease signature motif containing protein [Bacillus toyonensis]|uniref:HNH endonuclease signature motif containing protein n=1 Tax=Bacillus toyonensis TaxID=155322 RepID=UPI00253FFDED|nr:HNH endonuclease signature motif containing protein [Bacillus toyonensis]WIG41991.1 HNH endonuclease signature motif containing protein [Bacillus toyonensis]
MKSTNIPHFSINNNYQKSTSHYSDFLTNEILKDICLRITGIDTYTVDFINEVNVGKLALLEYNGSSSYVLIPDLAVDGRNAYFQSFPTSLVRYYADPNTDKNIYFYFLPFEGNNNTNYYRFLYRLMATAGVQFLNTTDYLPNDILPFATIEDIMAGRELNRNRNKSNNSTYITKNTDNVVEIFGKTYGANKKETTLLCLALSNLLEEQAKLYIICEQNLTNLPAPDLAIINSLGKIEVIPTTLTMERKLLEEHADLRSPHFIYNLLDKLGPKKCAFCECDIPQLIQGAHIWPVASIKKEHQLTLEEKLDHATNRDNGIWLCANHHKLFDENLLTIEISGDIKFSDKIAESSLTYLTNSTSKMVLEPAIGNEQVEFYISKRYS